MQIKSYIGPAGSFPYQWKKVVLGSQLVDCSNQLFLKSFPPMVVIAVCSVISSYDKWKWIIYLTLLCWANHILELFLDALASPGSMLESQSVQWLTNVFEILSNLGHTFRQGSLFSPKIEFFHFYFSSHLVAHLVCKFLAFFIPRTIAPAFERQNLKCINSVSSITNMLLIITPPKVNNMPP